MRVIRDHLSYTSKGFCYVKLQTVEEVEKALDSCLRYKEWELRISKAKRNK